MKTARERAEEIVTVWYGKSRVQGDDDLLIELITAALERPTFSDEEISKYTKDEMKKELSNALAIDVMAQEYATKICTKYVNGNEVSRVPVVDPDMYDAFLAGFRKCQELGAATSSKSPQQVLVNSPIDESHSSGTKVDDSRISIPVRAEQLGQSTDKMSQYYPSENDIAAEIHNKSPHWQLGFRHCLNYIALQTQETNKDKT